MKRSTENLRHPRWECGYHVGFIPKSRKKHIYGRMRKELGPIILDLASQWVSHSISMPISNATYL
jgi:REP element-mobilizing transposase RayT